jgi:hypothetical protein
MIAARAAAVGDGAMPAAVRWPGRTQQQRLHQHSQLVRHEFANKSRHKRATMPHHPEGSDYGV